MALHFLVVSILIFWKFGLIDACFGVKTILEEVTLFIELLVDVGSLQEVTLNEGLLMKNNLLWLHGGPFSHQLPPCLTIRSRQSPSVSLRSYGLLSGPIERLSNLVFLISLSWIRTRITFDISSLAEVTKMVVLTCIAELPNAILRLVVPILILFDDLLYPLPLNTGNWGFELCLSVVSSMNSLFLNWLWRNIYHFVLFDLHCSIFWG